MEQFGLSAEELKLAERKVSVFSIMNTLTPEQLSQVEDTLINISLLTPVQREIVEEAIAFDAALAMNCSDTASRIHRLV